MTKLYDLIELNEEGAIVVGEEGRRMVMVSKEDKIHLYREVSLNKYERVQTFKDLRK